MSLIFDPRRIIGKILPYNSENLLTKDLRFKDKYKSSLNRLDWLSGKDFKYTLNNTLKYYKDKIKTLQAEGEGKAEAKADALNGGKLLNARLSDLIVSKASEDVKEKYSGQKYIWLPSDAEEIDPVHALNYGKTFTIGEGEMPGERYGCRCGMEILTNDIYEAPGIYKLGATSGAQKRAEMQRQGQAAVSKEIAAKEKQIAENEAKIKQALKENAPKQQDLPLKTETPLNLTSVTPANAGVSVHSIKSALPTQLFTTDGKLIDYEKWITTPFAVKKFFNAINFKDYYKILTAKEIEALYTAIRAEFSAAKLDLISKEYIDGKIAEFKAQKAAKGNKTTSAPQKSQGGATNAPKQVKKALSRADKIAQKADRDKKAKEIRQQRKEERILGIKRAEPMPPDEAVKDVNPNYHKSKEYRINCTYCALSNELRRRGYHVEAQPMKKDREIFEGDECFKNSQVIGKDFLRRWKDVFTPNEVITELNTYPDNSRFILTKTMWRNYRHSLNCEKINGKLNFYDAQDPSRNAEEKFRQATKASFFRVDNLELNENSNWKKIIKKDNKRK